MMYFKSIRPTLPATRFMLCAAWHLALAIGFSSIAQAQVGTVPDSGVRFIPPTTFFLRGARIVVDSRREIEKGDVLVRDGKIAAIGVNLQAPPDAQIVDCSGKRLYPAFVDAYAEFAVGAVEQPSMHWNEQVMPQRRVDQLLKKDDQQFSAYRKAGIGAVLAAPADRVFKGASCVLTTSDQPLEATLLRSNAFQHVRLLPTRGAQRGYPNSPMGAVALARQTMIDAAWHQQAFQAFRADVSLPKPDHNVSLEALERAARGEQSAMIDGPNELYALRADRFAREFSLKAVIRGSGREYRQLSAIADTHRSFVIPVNFPKPPDVGSAEAAAEASLQALMHWHLAPENPGRLEFAGVNFAFTADGLANASDLLPNVRKAVARGLSESAALASLTTRPAELLGVEALVGSLESGKLANLLVCDGPLLNKPTKILETWVQGRRYRFDEKPDLDPAGNWSLACTGPNGFPSSLELQLSDAFEKPKGRLALVGEFTKEAANKTKSSKPEPDSKSDQPNAADRKPEAKDSTGAAKNQDSDEKPRPTSVRDEAAKAGEGGADSTWRIAELKQMGVHDHRLAAVFEAKALGLELSGVAFFTAAIIPKGSTIQLSGSIIWPDGRSSLFNGELAKPEDTREPAKQGAPNAGKRVANDSRSTSDQEPDSKQSGSVASSQSKASEATGAISCDVNYPLGDAGTPGKPERFEWLVLRNATIWTCGQQGTIEGADLLIHNGCVESVGKNLKAPEGAVAIDVQGKHVSPGIIDCHSHMATDGGVNESGQAVTAEVRIGDFLDSNDLTIYRQLAGGVTAANVLHGSANPIGGQNQVIKLRWGALDEELKMSEAPPGIKFALGENVKQSNFTQERASPRYPQTRMGVEQLIRDRLEAAKLYAKRRGDWVAGSRGLPPRRDLELDALVEVLEGKRWIHCHSYRQDEILAFLRLLEEYHVQVGSLQHILEGYKVADAMAKHGASGSSFSDWWAYKFEVFDAIPFNGALMHRAGVVVSFNSDDGELARHLNHEAAKAMKYGGLPAEEALKFVTLNPAKQLRIDKWVGSLEAGKHADFVVWRGSPLSTLSVCEQTWIDGRKYFDRQEDQRQRDRADQLRRQLIQEIHQSGEKMGDGDDERRDPSTWWVRYDEFCHHHEHEDGEGHTTDLDLFRK